MENLKYYLAFIRSYGKSDEHYLLVLAEDIEDAKQKVIKKEGSNKIIDIQETII